MLVRQHSGGHEQSQPGGQQSAQKRAAGFPECQHYAGCEADMQRRQGVEQRIHCNELIQEAINRAIRQAANESDWRGKGDEY